MSNTNAAMDAYIEEQMRRLNIPGAALAVVERDRIVHARGFGRARADGGAPTPHTPFFIGSLTKSFTALAVMQLVEAGKVALDAPVQCYLPWFRIADPRASAQITVRHLLNQTSGLPMLRGVADLGNLDNRAGAAERQVRALSTLELNHPPGAQFEYSNTNYSILGLIVEAASGEAYADTVQRHIFDPLGMGRSYTAKSVAQQNGLAMGHRYWFGRPVPASSLTVPAGSLAAGQLISSAEDMARYLLAYLNGGQLAGAQVLSQTGIAEMLSGAAEINEMGQSPGAYGMGWISQGTGAARLAWHSGIVPDFGGFMALAPKQKKGLVLLFNANHAALKLAFDEMGLGAAKLLIGEAPAPNRFAAFLWVMRGMLLVPLVQLAGVATTLRLLRRWHADPALRPARGRMWGRHVLLPLVPNLLPALALLPLLSKMRSFLRLFMPDFSSIALVSGGFALAWSVLRTALVLRQNASGRERWSKASCSDS